MIRRSTICILFSLCSVYAFSQSLNWTSEVIVANGSTYGNVRPRVAATAGNIPLVVWGGGTGTQPLYYARGNGSGFGMAMSLTPNNDPAVMDWQGHDIGSNGNTVYVVFKEQPEMMGNIYIRKSTDGGVTWSDTVRVDGMNGPYSRFPSIAVTDAGNPAVMFMSFDSNWMSATYVVTNSTDGGQTFPMPVNASGVGGSDVCDCCPAYMTTDGTTQACVWRRNDNNRRDMWAAISTNNGTTFPIGIDVDDTDWMISACPSSGPTPHLSGDSLITVFMSGAIGDNRLYVSTYSISTQQVGFSTQLATNISSTADQNYPFAAGNMDTIMVVWQQLDGTNLNTYYSWSVTGAAGLVDNAALLNTSTPGAQQNPHVAYSNGMFHVVFTDMSSGNVIYKSATINPTGLNEPAANGLSVFPNPSRSVITLNSDKLIDQVIVRDVTGRIVYSASGVNSNVAVIPKQVSGIYFSELKNEDGEVSVVQLMYQ